MPTLTDETTDLALTRADVLALRNAETLSFCSNRDGNYIRATKQHDPGDGYGKRELAQNVRCGPPSVENHNTSDADGDSFGSTVRCHYNPVVQTFLHFLRAGDVLMAKFTLGNDTERMKERGFTRDDLAVQVQRGDKLFEFILDTMVTEPGKWRMRFKG